MRLRRGRAADPIADFWAWWVGAGAAQAEAGIGGGGFDGFVEAISTRVDAIDGSLSWELTAGRVAQHALVVTAGGLPAARGAAARWLAAAPLGDGRTWEFHPSRQPEDLAGKRVTLDGHDVCLDDVVVGLDLDDSGHRVDVVAHHPVFAEAPEDVAAQIAFLSLDWALGEDGVVRWLGSIETSPTRPPGGVPLSELVEQVRGLEARLVPGTWAVLGGTRDGHEVLAMAMSPGRWIDHPLRDHHVAVVLPFADRTPAGLPGPTALAALRDVEDQLADRLGDALLLVAHETWDGSRTLHHYAAGEVARADVEAVVSGWPGARVTVGPDPGWTAVRHLTS